MLEINKWKNNKIKTRSHSLLAFWSQGVGTYFV